MPLFLSLTLSIFAIPGFKILQETVGHGIKASDGADFAFLPCAAQYVPFENAPIALTTPRNNEGLMFLYFTTLVV